MSKTNYPLYDLHLHRSEKQSMQDMMDKAGKNSFKCFGVVQNVSPRGIRTNADPEKYIAEVKDYPCYMGLQPAAPGWSANLSKELIDKVDYILMDPQYMPNGNKYGDQMEVWDHNCYIDDPDDFMERNMSRYLEVVAGETCNLRCGYIHIALSVGGCEAVDALTERLRADGYEIASGPRTTGDGCYESCAIGPEGCLIEITV